MYTLFEEPKDFRALSQTIKDLLAAILEQIPPQKADVKIPATDSVYGDADRKGRLYLLTEGCVQYEREGLTLYYYDEGDLFGLEQLLSLKGGTLSSDFAVVGSEYGVDYLLEKIGKDTTLHRIWNQYLCSHMSIINCLTRSFVKEDMQFTPEIRSFHPGEVIIQQGDAGTEVYTLGEGQAEVSVDGVKVGEVQSEEIFGAIAALTETPRTATVTAQTACLVLALPKEKFIQLVKNRPATVEKLVDDMARKITSLNDRLVELGGP